MGTPIRRSAERKLTEAERETLLRHSNQIEAELRHARAQLLAIPPNDIVAQVLRDLDNELVRTNLLVIPNITVGHFILSRLPASYQIASNWLETAGLSKTDLSTAADAMKSLGNALRAFKVAAELLGEAAGRARSDALAAPSRATRESGVHRDLSGDLVRLPESGEVSEAVLMDLDDLDRPNAAEGLSATPAPSAKPNASVLQTLISPRAVRVELLILAALVFSLARTPTRVGGMLREFSSWLLG